jgi:hypothetical protein
MTPHDPAAADDAENANGADDPSPWWKRADWHLIVQILLFIVGIKVALIYSGQLEQMRKSTEATKSAADTAQRTLVIANRTWVEMTLEPPFNPPIFTKKVRKGLKSLEFPLIFKNIGKSPVKKVTIITAAEVLKSNESTTFSYGGIYTSVTANILYPGRGSGVTTTVWATGSTPNNPNNKPESVTPELREDLRLARKYIVVYARGTFEDDLGQHWFNFCNWIALPDINANFTSRNCTDYNGTGDFQQ